MAERLVASQEGMGVGVPVREFGAWMMSEQKRVFLLCCRILQDSDEADMATQDSFLKVHQALQRHGEPIDDAGRWLTRIAVNTCLDRLRSRTWRAWRKRPQAEEEAAILGLAAEGSPNAEDQVYAGQIQRRLSAAMGKLSARQRAVFTLKHYEDRRLEEIAEILQVDVGTVKAHMARALTKLRAELRDLYGLPLSGEGVVRK